MKSEDRCEAFPFSDDFAARVLLATDKAMARQRRIHVTTAAMVTSVLTILAVAAPWRGAPSIPSVRPAPSQVVASMEPDAISLTSTAGDTQTEPLDYMFPDAEPLSQFSSQYVNTTAAEQDNDIFSDDTEEAGGS
jgi:hypothetical protein